MEKDSRLRFVAKGVGAFFGLLVPFLATSSYFGGGIIGVTVSTVVALAAALGLLVIWPQLPAERRHSEVAKESLDNGPCAIGPYKVSPGKSTKIQLQVREGDTIDGHIAEVDNYHFSWFVMDEENLTHYLNDEHFNDLEGDVNVAASKLRFTVPNDGPWFLLLDASGKQFARQVEVHLRTL
jgi:hypothetical protein